MKRLITYTLLFIIYFVLHYIEGLPPIGGLSIAQLWKLPLIGYLLACVLSTKRKFNKFEKTGYLYSIEPYFCPAIVTNPFSIVSFSMRQLPIPLFYNFWLRFNKTMLEKLLLYFSHFICLTSLITLTGIVEPLKEYLSADAFMEDLEYYSSVFATTHAASSYFCISSTVIVFFFINNKFRTNFERIYNLFLLAIAIYSLFLAYVRTGWLMLAVSLLLIIDLKKFNFVQKVKTAVALIMIVIGLVFLYNTNEAFRLRISGGGQYRGESEQMIDTGGSGRSDFWKSGITNWAKNDLYSLFFGKGLDAVLDDNHKATGMRVFSHSLIIDSLAQYGIISLVLLITLFIQINKFIKRYGRGSPYQRLSRAIFYAGMIFCAFQSQMQFDYIIIFTISLVLMYKTGNRYNNLMNTKPV